MSITLVESLAKQREEFGSPTLDLIDELKSQYPDILFNSSESEPFKILIHLRRRHNVESLKSLNVMLDDSLPSKLSYIKAVSESINNRNKQRLVNFYWALRLTGKSEVLAWLDIENLLYLAVFKSDKPLKAKDIWTISGLEARSPYQCVSESKSFSYLTANLNSKEEFALLNQLFSLFDRNINLAQHYGDNYLESVISDLELSKPNSMRSISRPTFWKFVNVHRTLGLLQDCLRSSPSDKSLERWNEIKQELEGQPIELAVLRFFRESIEFLNVNKAHSKLLAIINTIMQECGAPAIYNFADIRLNRINYAIVFINFMDYLIRDRGLKVENFKTLCFLSIRSENIVEKLIMSDLELALSGQTYNKESFNIELSDISELVQDFDNIARLQLELFRENETKLSVDDMIMLMDFASSRKYETEEMLLAKLKELNAFEAYAFSKELVASKSPLVAQFYELERYLTDDRSIRFISAVIANNYLKSFVSKLHEEAHSSPNSYAFREFYCRTKLVGLSADFGEYADDLLEALISKDVQVWAKAVYEIAEKVQTFIEYHKPVIEALALIRWTDIRVVPINDVLHKALNMKVR